MRRVILQIDVTLDGFAAAVDGGQGWVKGSDEMNQDAKDLLDTADTLLLGRVAYQLMAADWPFADTTSPTLLSQITAHINQATKIVFSKTLNSVDWGPWNNAQVARGPLTDEIAALKSQPGKNLLLYGGPRLVAEFMRLGLIDEYRLRVHPVVLGAGQPLFKDIDPLTLSLVDSRAYPHGVVMLIYRSLTSS